MGRLGFAPDGATKPLRVSRCRLGFLMTNAAVAFQSDLLRPVRSVVTPPLDAGLPLEAVVATMDELVLRGHRGFLGKRLGEIAHEHLQTGGKRLRARLALATAQALGADPKTAVGWAAACELLHQASLIHDDLQDGDTHRRGRPTTWAKHGVAQAINAGDLLLMLPYDAVERCGCDDATRWQLCRALAGYASEAVRGQATELDLLPEGRLDWQSYLEVVEGKTAALLALPVFGAAMIAGRNRDAAEGFATEFRRLGILFQLQDDVLDLYGDKGRERAANDLYEGKVSALVVEHVRLHPGDREPLLDLLRTPRCSTSAEAVEWAVRRFQEGGAVEGVLRRIRDLVHATESSRTLALEPALHAVAVRVAGVCLAPIQHLF